ncbi:N-acetylmuramoyl-L-alanine amidase CwlD [Calidifontibacillus erzurumensis]|uniref:N-acetylmuramoyl-L-alanine amidase CwlD n=1 Tax=Calidifontibacillus erzurumensis TaxID=2741433 RepID=A0A8J8GER3_9BACI|nr:N-acetylmuramoyl-L-alanine amidase CwlD [Calidifontibacillus erzurumensis]NSL52545.1 N-acetylmuramoyl-L-alanine amidase CwlD [Calidifontibacillus erzurumensis]
MKRKIQFFIFICGTVLLFFLFQYQFSILNTWDSWSLPLSGKVIIVDPGHGYPDPGAGPEGAYEKDIAFNISLLLRDYLQEAGALVIMTREDDNDLADKDLKGYSRRKTQDLMRRVELINNSNGDLLISVHLNSLPSPRWSGAQTFYYPRYEENKRLAELIQKEMQINLGNTVRHAKAINHVYVLKEAKMPSVLVEAGFLSNPAEREKLKTKAYQDKVAASIYQGILRLYTEKPKDSNQ